MATEKIVWDEWINFAIARLLKFERIEKVLMDWEPYELHHAARLVKADLNSGFGDGLAYLLHQLADAIEGC